MKSMCARALSLLVLFAVAVFAADIVRPEKQNPSYNPNATATSSFGLVTTGVSLKILSAGIAKDGTITAKFTLQDANGAGLDVNGVFTPGVEGLSFVAAYIPNNGSQYIAYTTTVDKATTNNNASQTQASTDKGGTFTLIDAATGTYTYTFGTKAPVTYDPTATHSIGAQVERDLSAYGYASMFTSDFVYNFVPNGAPVTHVRDVINEASCNSCHDPLSAHGSPGPRQKIAFCVLCHTPQSTNPDSLNTVDMKVFIHKLHMGSSLPSVAAGGKYFVVHRGSVQDYSSIVFPQDIRNCTTCHASGPTQANNWTTKPSQAVCGSCHDDVNFATGQNHVNLPQVDDSQCANCHVSTQHLEFDASIPGAHVVPNNSTQIAGLVQKIINVTNTSPGSNPVVSFSVTDQAGNPVDVTKLTSFRVVLAGANVDYGVNGMRVSETPTAASLTAGSGGTYTYTMTNKIPAAAAGSYTVSLLASNNVTLNAGTTQQQTAVASAAPVEYYFSVDKSPVVARRQVVSLAKCSACHQNLTFVHGGSRNDTQACVMCHNPTLTDGTSNQSVNFATQIHSIHRGENLTNPYILGTTNYQDVRFPGDLRVCTTCHLDGTYQVDNVGAQAAVASPGGFTKTTPPISAACQGCHDDKATASHALSNTTVLGEACVTCHGINGEFSVDTVHARTL